MQTTIFKPKLVTGFKTEDGIEVAPVFSGHIELKVPDYFERQKMKTLLLLAVTVDGETDIESIQTAAGKKSVDVLRVMEGMGDLIRESIPFYSSVNLVNLKTNSILKSFDDLSRDPAAESILQEVAQELANGISVGKN